jgi:hypothetical protein
MKKIAFGILVTLVAASPALAAKKKMAAEPTVFERNEAGYRLVRDSLPIYLPTWAMPIYMASQQPVAAPKKSKKR